MQILKSIKLIMVTAFFLFVISLNTYAGSWRQDGNGWWYQNSDGSYPRNAWQWIDANDDHIAYCYYFNNDGYCLLNQKTPDGYRVSSSGEWIIADVGLPETKIVNTSGVNLDVLPYMASCIRSGFNTDQYLFNYKNVNIDFNKESCNPRKQVAILSRILHYADAHKYFTEFTNKYYKIINSLGECRYILDKEEYAKAFEDLFGIYDIEEAWSIEVKDKKERADAGYYQGDSSKIAVGVGDYGDETPFFMAERVIIEGNRYTVKGRCGSYINNGDSNEFSSASYTIVAEENPDSDFGHLTIRSIKINND